MKNQNLAAQRDHLRSTGLLAAPDEPWTHPHGGFDLSALPTTGTSRANRRRRSDGLGIKGARV